MSSNTEKIKDALLIEEVIASYVKLEPSGKYLKARCPFHNERTPSFVVTPERQTYHCFGCGKGGDLFSFIQEIEGVEFYDALLLLADRAGITIEKNTEADGEKSRKKIYLDIMEAAQKWFEVQLRKDTEVIEYLKHRGLAPETMETFHIGYAPESWDGLLTYLQSKDYEMDDIIAVGLAGKGKKGPIDQFRERIMFPITDAQGRTVAFTGRIFIRPGEVDNPPEYKVKTGKYINSPETPLYNKSKILYGYHLAKDAMRTKKRVVVTEGQLDCIMSYQAGITETVAISGTALTAEQVRLLMRFTQHIILAFDMDKAGLSAMYKSALLGYDEGCAVSAIGMKKDDDPASYIVDKGDTAWKKLVDNAIPYITYLVKLLQAGRGEIKAIARIQKKIFPLIVRLPLRSEQDEALQQVARMLDVSPEAVLQDFAVFQSQDHNDTPQTTQNDIAPKVSPPTEQTDVSRLNALVRALFSIMWWGRESTRSDIDTDKIHDVLYDELGEDAFSSHDTEFSPQRTTLVFEAEMRYDTLSKERLSDAIEEMILEFRLCKLHDELSRVREQLRKAENSNDDEASQTLLQHYQEISQKIQSISHRS